ncbi:MAG TPA: hypothetical protein D7H86_00820 [Candidatus Poseidoniales archaeon]|nr:MAG TPA: hypothetical protein D7H86_00820 [Candidatus Poseidoniales archaeon]
MNLETASQLGEMLGGLAIVFTLLFGVRQVLEVNRNRRFEISQTIANSLENPLVQRGFAILGRMGSDTSLEDISAMSREDKDAANSVIVLMANHAVMTFHRNLSFDIVTSFYRGYLPLISNGLRRIMSVVEAAYIQHEQSGLTEENGLGTNHWVFWLLDRMVENQSPEEHKPHLHQKDWNPKK